MLRALESRDECVQRLPVFSLSKKRGRRRKAQGLLATSDAPLLDTKPRNGLFWASAQDEGGLSRHRPEVPPCLEEPKTAYPK